MNRSSSFCRCAVALVFSAVVVHRAAANPPDILRKYRFIPADTNVHVSGGSPGYNLNLTIAGKFGLVTGYQEEPSIVAAVPTLDPFAQFVNVHAILYNPLSVAPLPVPGWDLDKTLNLSGLHGTFSVANPNQLFFIGADGQGVAERFEADLNGGWLHLTGGSSDPPSTNSVLYRVDALAHLAPFPDFNGDGIITSADLNALTQALTDPTAFETGHNLSSDDFIAMGDIDTDGNVTNADIQAMLYSLIHGTYLIAGSESEPEAFPVPEPTTVLLMLACVIGGLPIVKRLRRKSDSHAVRGNRKVVVSTIDSHFKLFKQTTLVTQVVSFENSSL